MTLQLTTQGLLGAAGSLRLPHIAAVRGLLAPAAAAAMGCAPSKPGLQRAAVYAQQGWEQHYLCRLSLFPSMLKPLAGTSVYWQVSAYMTLHLALLLSARVVTHIAALLQPICAPSLFLQALACTSMIIVSAGFTCPCRSPFLHTSSL